MYVPTASPIWAHRFVRSFYGSIRLEKGDLLLASVYLHYRSSASSSCDSTKVQFLSTDCVNISFIIELVWSMAPPNLMGWDFITLITNFLSGITTTFVRYDPLPYHRHSRGPPDLWMWTPIKAIASVFVEVQFLFVISCGPHQNANDRWVTW